MFAPEHIERSQPLTNGARGRSRLLLLALTTTLAAAGGAAPYFFVSDHALRHAVETSLRVDAPGLSASERHRAVADAQKAVSTPASLDGMVRSLELAREPEFAPAAPGALGVVADIVTGRAMTVSAADARLRERLAASFTARTDAGSNRIVISVTSRNADTAARIAGAVADTWRHALSATASHAADTQLRALERTMQDAENAVSQALAKTGDPGRLRRAEEERRTLAQDVATLEASVLDLADNIKTVTATSLADVLTKPLSSAFDFTGIEQMRQAHVDAKMLVDQLSASLGPRHPRLLGAQASLADARAKIETALTRLSATLKQQEATARRELADLKARQKAANAAMAAPELEALADLQAKAEKAREDYLGATRRLDAAATSDPISATTLKAADPADAKTIGWPMWMLCAAGAFLGQGFGLVLGLALPRRAEDADAQDTVPDEAFDLFEDEEIDLLRPVSDDGMSGDLSDPAASPVAATPGRPRRVYHAVAEPRVDTIMPDAPAAANDSATPLADRVRALLLANRMREDEAAAHLPPLVAAVMAGGMSGAMAAEPRRGEPVEEAAGNTAALRNDILSLRERVAQFSERRTAGQR